MNYITTSSASLYSEYCIYNSSNKNIFIINFLLLELEEYSLKNMLCYTQSCPTLCNPMDYSTPEILQARILEWVAISSSRGSP